MANSLNVRAVKLNGLMLIKDLDLLLERTVKTYSCIFAQFEEKATVYSVTDSESTSLSVMAKKDYKLRMLKLFNKSRY